MLNITLFTSVAKSALVGAVATKLVDTLISTQKLIVKLNKANGLEIQNQNYLHSKLTEDILFIESSNVEEQLREIKRTSAKIILLVNDRKLTEKIESYINHLNKYNISKRQNKVLQF